MSKNLIPEIAKLLGVEMEEAFKIRRPDYEVCENGIYAFFENEGLMKKNEQGEFDNNSSIEFEDLCLGNYEIEQLPWEPKNGEIYWTIVFKGDGKPFATSRVWSCFSVDFSRKALGMVYRTKAEAQTHLSEDYKRLTGKPLSCR